MNKITLSEGWNLRSARSLDELNAIVNDLHEHCGDCDGGVDGTADRLGVPRDIVERVSRYYQSLWMHV